MKRKWILLAGAAAIGAAAFPYLLSRGIFGFALDRKRKLSLAKFFGYEKEMEQPAFQEAAAIFNQKRQVVALNDHEFASFVPAQDSHNYVILCHGFGNDLPDGMCGYAVPYMDHGYNVLTPYAPSHHKSTGRYISMGWPERQMMARWAQWIRERDPEAEIVIHGVSMGGATALNTAGENPEGLVAAIGDCAYTSVWDQFKSVTWGKFYLPPFPFLHIGSLMAKRRMGFHFKEADTTSQLRKTKVPVLLFHGEKDNFVPPWMMEVNYAAIPGMKHKVTAPEAVHANSAFVHDAYWDEVFSFIERAKKYRDSQ